VNQKESPDSRRNIRRTCRN